MTKTLLSAWETILRADPGARVIIDAANGQPMSRADLDAHAEAWRDAHGAGLAGQAVVLAEENRPDWFQVFLGLLKSDAIIVPLDPGEPLAAQIGTATAIRAA